MNLITAIAYHPQRKLCTAYNEIMSRMKDDDWVCFIDHDAMFTTYNWWIQIFEIINAHSDGGLFVPMTNRIGVRVQVPWAVKSKQVLKEYGGSVYTIDGNSHNIRFHREVGDQLYQNKTFIVKDITNKISNGVVMVTSKVWWNKVGGFNEGRTDLGGCDTDYHRAINKAGGRVYLMEGVYVYHWYREPLTLE